MENKVHAFIIVAVFECLHAIKFLSHFKLYRQALIRTAQKALVHAFCELRQTTIQEMENNQDCNDKQRIQYLISEGLERLKRLDEMLEIDTISWHWFPDAWFSFSE
ncbi:hypothetical protein UlMin_001459 [Ulmus minor]